jgi:hypothetical protein
MIRKLSVASITSNFTKRSGSVVSLQKATEDELPLDVDVLQTSPVEQGSSEETMLPDAEDMTRSRLSVIQDEKEHVQNGSVEGIGYILRSDGSSMGSMHRFVHKTVKGSLGPDGQRIITPPLRTSSANSLNQNRAAPLSTGTDVPSEEKENIPQTQPASTPEKHGKRGRGMGKNRVMVEGIRSLFR